MKKFSKLVLMLCLVLSGALCYASNATKTENKKGNGITLEVKQKVFHGSSDKSGSIVPTLDGHVLTVIFTENLGQVAVEVSTAVGTLVHYPYAHRRSSVHLRHWGLHHHLHTLQWG